MLNYITLTNKRTWLNKYLNEESLNLLDLTFKIPNDFDFLLIEVTKKYIARPDILSKDAYDDDMYADIICKLNGISNPFELNEGMLIMLPDMNDIHNFVVLAKDNIISIDDKDIYENNLPKPKLKNQKRKANEAVVGDSRFKIDTVNKIIIY